MGTHQDAWHSLTATRETSSLATACQAILTTPRRRKIGCWQLPADAGPQLLHWTEGAQAAELQQAYNRHCSVVPFGRRAAPAAPSDGSAGAPRQPGGHAAVGPAGDVDRGRRDAGCPRPPVQPRGAPQPVAHAPRAAVRPEQLAPEVRGARVERPIPLDSSVQPHLLHIQRGRCCQQAGGDQRSAVVPHALQESNRSAHVPSKLAGLLCDRIRVTGGRRKAWARGAQEPAMRMTSCWAEVGRQVLQASFSDCSASSTPNHCQALAPKPAAGCSTACKCCVPHACKTVPRGCAPPGSTSAAHRTWRGGAPLQPDRMWQVLLHGADPAACHLQGPCGTAGRAGVACPSHGRPSCPTAPPLAACRGGGRRRRSPSRSRCPPRTCTPAPSGVIDPRPGGQLRAGGAFGWARLPALGHRWMVA